jgi:hypothetical protein
VIPTSTTLSRYTTMESGQVATSATFDIAPSWPHRNSVLAGWSMAVSVLAGAGTDRGSGG